MASISLLEVASGSIPSWNSIVRSNISYGTLVRLGPGHRGVPAFFASQQSETLVRFFRLITNTLLTWVRIWKLNMTEDCSQRAYFPVQMIPFYLAEVKTELFILKYSGPRTNLSARLK